MPATNPTFTPTRIIFLCLGGLVTLWFLGFFSSTNPIMDSIPSPFTIEINGKSLAKIAPDTKDHTPAKLGKDAAVFSLKNNILQCGDWIVGRNLTENRSFGPKKVSWYKKTEENEKQVQLVTAKNEGQAYQLIFTKGTLMVGDDDMIMVDLLGEAKDEVKIVLQED